MLKEYRCTKQILVVIVFVVIKVIFIIFILVILSLKGLEFLLLIFILFLFIKLLIEFLLSLKGSCLELFLLILVFLVIKLILLIFLKVLLGLLLSLKGSSLKLLLLIFLLFLIKLLLLILKGFSLFFFFIFLLFLIFFLILLSLIDLSLLVKVLYRLLGGLDLLSIGLTAGEQAAQREGGGAGHGDQQEGQEVSQHLHGVAGVVTVAIVSSGSDQAQLILFTPH